MDKKTVKIGKITCGAIFLVAGVLLIVNMFSSFVTFKAITSLWPLILVGLGIETLYYAGREDIESKFDFWGCIFSFIVIGICFSFYTLNLIATNFYNYGGPELIEKICK
jgi:NO-binding membrane sensor protein with MHYT domain